GEYLKDNLFRILSLDGGGAKGFYTLGILKEIEGFLKCPLHQCFDLMFGTSTGSIIASLLALGYEVDQIRDLYRQYVPSVMKARWAWPKQAAVKRLGTDIFGGATFNDVKTGVGVEVAGALGAMFPERDHSKQKGRGGRRPNGGVGRGFHPERTRHRQRE